MPLDSEVLAAIASPRRREILRLVWHREVAAGDIHAAMPDVTFGAVSLHLRALAAAGLVACRRDGQRRLYTAQPARLGSLARELERMWDEALWRLKLQAELEHSRRGPRPARGGRHGAKKTSHKKGRAS